MIFAADFATARNTRFSRTTREGAAIWRSDYFGPPPSPTDAASVDPRAANALEYVDPAPGERRLPQAFLVEQGAGAVVHPHFHFVDQFQVAVEGEGTIGRFPLAPITAHFAGACTGYGPIRAGEAGLSYFTLRASADSTGAQFLPAAKHKMRPVRRRHRLADPVIPSDAEALARRREPVIETALDEADGLAVHLLRIPPSGRLHAPDPQEGAGQSLLVVAGYILHGGTRLDRLSALFVSADEPAFAAEAGPAGAELLLLQYPRAD